MRLEIESKIKYLVDVEKITMSVIAEKTGIHVSTISNIYRMKYNITEETLDKLKAGYPEYFSTIAPTEKKCGTCGLVKPLDSFYKSKDGKYGRGYRCKPCDNKARKDCRHKSEESKQFYYVKTRGRMLKSKYDLSLEQYEDMLAAQNHRCKICGTDNPAGEGVNRDGILSFAVDHCHATLQVRGLLCNLCNRALGFLQDDPEIVRKALKYLETYK